MAMECVNEPMKRCCFRCGETGHDSRDCKNEVCYNCFESGHVAAHCPQPKQGSLDISELKDPFNGMKVPFKDLEKVRCMSCDKFGHINCEAVIEFGEIDIFCYMCGSKGHTGDDCKNTKARFSGSASWGDGDARNSVQRDYNCYKCGGIGHIAKNCPRQNMLHNNSVNHSRKRRTRYSQDNNDYSGNYNGRGTFHRGRKRFRSGNTPIGRGGHSRR